MAGDRWIMGQNEFVVRSVALGRVRYYNSWLRLNDSCKLEWFQNWAAKAKFQGGDDEIL
jgi:hypothetical protein